MKDSLGHLWEMTVFYGLMIGMVIMIKVVVPWHFFGCKIKMKDFAVAEGQ